tara:strand:- start:409 stop:624 length:216 start_codon:yes stop_codon:yes gene_type:complete
MNTIDPREYSFSRFPKHDRINTEMHNIVSKNIQSSIGHMHARETLDDVIDDLIQYRDSIATVEEYLEKNYL